VKLAFELDSNTILYYYNGQTKISEFGALSDGEKLTFSTEDLPDGFFTDLENAAKNGRAKRVNADDKRKFKQLEQTANSLYSNQHSEPSPQIIKSPKGRVGRQQKPLDITGAPGYDKLGEEEKTLCTALRLTPQLYIDIKTVLTTEFSKQGYLKKQQARSLIKIDVNKTAAIFDFLQEQGWINNGSGALQQQQPQQHQTHHQVVSHQYSNPYVPQQQSFLAQENYMQQNQNQQQQQQQQNANTLHQTHELIQTPTMQPQQQQQQQQQSQQHQSQQRLSLLPNHNNQQLPQQHIQQVPQPIILPQKVKQEQMMHQSTLVQQQPPTKKVKRENNSISHQQTMGAQTISKANAIHAAQQQQQQQQNANGQTSNVVYERVFVSYQTKGTPQHPIFYAIPQSLQQGQHPQHTHMQTTHHIQQTNSHLVGPHHVQQGQHIHHQNNNNQQFTSTYTTPQSDDNIQHPQDSSSGEEPVLDLWDPAALQAAQNHEDHWGSVLDVQARDSMNMPAFNPNYPQANLQYTQYVPDDVANLPFPTSHQ